MPTYEYKCEKCGHGFEHFQNMSDKRLSKCPKCRGKLKRLLGAGAGIIFKGSGFYQTDYVKKAQPSVASEDSGSKAKSEAKVQSKKERPGSS